MNLRPGLGGEDFLHQCFGGGLVAVERAGDSLGCKVKVEKRLKTGNMYQMYQHVTGSLCFMQCCIDHVCMSF